VSATSSPAAPGGGGGGGAPKGTTSLKAFGSGVTIAGSSATINMNSTGLDGGGVFPSGNAQQGLLLNRVTYAFSNQGDVGGGSPRFSIPIEDGTFNTNDGPYAFMDPTNCGYVGPGDNPGGVTTLVSTQNPNCHVNFKGGDYANWNALAAAFPTYRIAKATPFIIADSLPTGFTSATYVVTGIVFKP
jgi:hypothetical protein